MALHLSLHKGAAGLQQRGRSAMRAPVRSRPAQARASKGIVQYMVERRTTSPARSASAAPGAPADAVVLSVLQNYSGLTVDRLYNMLRNSGKFNESQSTLNSILSGLVSEGKVQNERGTFRFLSKTGSGSSAGRSFTPSASRSPSPAPRASAAPARSVASAGGAGDGRSAGDEANVLAVLQNYSGLTEDRLASMLRNSGKSTKSSLSSVLNGLVSQGKVQNDRGTFRYVATGKTPTASRTASPVPARSASPLRASAPSRSAPSAGGAGDGRSAGDEANVLAVLQNYSGLTEDRLASMLRNSGKSTKSSLSSVLNGLVSQGKVQNDRGTFRYVATGKTPTASRTASPAPRASFSSSAASRPASRPATPSAGGGAVSSDETVVLSVLKNYAGLTVDRLANMLRSSGKWSGSASSLEAVLRGLVSKGRVSSERGVYRFGK